MLNLIPPKSGKLRPVQLKKTLKPTSAKIAIDCESSRAEKYQKEFPKIFNFLKNLNLTKYIENFIKNGIDSEDKISLLNYDLLKMINIPYKYRHSILNKIKTENDSKNQTNTSFYNPEKYEELLCPAEEDDRVIDDEEQRRTFTQAILDFKRVNNKKNEEINSRYFNQSEKENKEINIPEKKEEETTIQVGEYVESVEPNHSGVQINPMSKGDREYFPLNKKKTLCYQCLHMILQEHCIQKYNKPFCSIHCVDVFELKNIIECKNCRKKIEIASSYPSMKASSVYYCSVDCLNKAEQNEIFKNDTNTSTVIVQSPSSSDSEQIVDILDI